MLGIESRTIGGEMPKKLEKMLIQRSTVKRKKDLFIVQNSVVLYTLVSCGVVRTAYFRYFSAYNVIGHLVI